jgi:hypothetical protein
MYLLRKRWQTVAASGERRESVVAPRGVGTYSTRMRSFKKSARNEVVAIGTAQVAALLELGGYIVRVLDDWYRGHQSVFRGFGELFPVL